MSIGQVFIVLITIYYIVKSGSKLDGILMLTGSCLSLLCSIFIQVGALLWEAETYAFSMYIISGISTLGSVLFVIGFFLLIRKFLKNTISTN